jgi:predicted DCC family thiol-disulfide oxidoreductase YuxK
MLRAGVRRATTNLKMLMESPLILYDDDCGFCKWMVQWFLLWDRAGTLRTLPIQSPDADPLLRHMAPDDRLASWHLALPDGALHSGGEAFPPLLRLLPGGKPFAAAVARIPGIADRAYRWVAKNRSALSKPLRRSWKDSAGRRVRARQLP